MKYIVRKREVHCVSALVEGDDNMDIRQGTKDFYELVNLANKELERGHEYDFEYSHTLPDDDHTTIEVFTEER